MTTPSQALRGYLRAPREHQLTYVAAKLRIPDLLSGRSRSSEDVARDARVDPHALHRAMRSMVAIGLLYEDEDGRFGLAPMGEYLRCDAPDSLRDDAIAAGEVFPAWAVLLHSVQTGQTAFEHVFGKGLFERFSQDPELGKSFERNMASMTTPMAVAVAAAHDFSSVGTLVDVGGGRGGLLSAVLGRYSGVRGVLFDLPAVVEGAREQLIEAGVIDRCTLVGGDFFESVPGGGDAYVLQAVLHDWDDDRALRILTNCREAMPEHGRLLLVERLLPKRVEQAPDVIEADLNMLVLTGGRERAEAEYRALLEAAGFRLTDIVPTSTRFSVLVGLPV